MLKHQYTDKGSHRIAKLDIGGFLESAGDWVGYQNIATFTTNVAMRGVKTYVAVTAYFLGGWMEPDRIYEIQEVPDNIVSRSESEVVQ